MTDLVLPAEIEDCEPPKPRPRARGKMLPEPSICNPPAHRPRKLVGEKRKAFLVHLALTGRWQESAAVAGVYRETPKELQRADPLFASQCAAAERTFHERLEAEILRRGHDGYDEVTTIEKEGEDGTSTTRSVVHRYSDKLLLAHAQARHPDFKRVPETLAQTQVSVSVGIGVDLAALSAEARVHLRALLMAAGPQSAAPEPTE